MCTSLNELLEIFKDRYYNEVRSLLEKSKVDLPGNQFICKYAARNLLEEMETRIQDRIVACGNDNCSKENSMLAAIYYLHSCISMDVDETSLGEESLNKSIELIKDNPFHFDNILIYVSCYNQLGLLWCERNDYSKALNYLKLSEEYYGSYSSDDEPTEFQKLLTGQEGEEDGRIALEKLHTLTLYYLAQALGASGDAVSAAAYCHRTLKRQLESSELDKADWALNAATLSQVLVERNAYREAKNHLVAASHLLELLRCDLDTDPNPDSDKHKAELELLSEREAEVCRCWAKYCLNLLTLSKDRLLDDYHGPSAPPGELCGLIFDSKEIQEENNTVSFKFALTWEDGLALYRHGCRFLDKAAHHYSLENHATDHVSIIRDQSQLYLALAFFSDDESKQCKMHKRRLDMLTNLSDKLNPDYYIDLLRQIWFEMGEIFITLINLKTDKICFGGMECISKINSLIKQGVAIFQKFIDSFNEHKNSQRYEEGYERSVLLSKIHVAKLLTKIKTDDVKLLIQYNTIAYSNFKEIVEYCDKWEKSDALTDGELYLCREMSNLLPLKLRKLLTRGQ